MRESISYSFLLNIVIVFITICAAIIMGTLSYYKAYKANKIISESIEKYEGYNCISAEEIGRKLNTIGYNTPFEVKCSESDRNCMTDEQNKYKIYSYNLDEGLESTDHIVYTEKYNKINNDIGVGYSNPEYQKYTYMNSSVRCSASKCRTNKNYQYGIYTYMYVELPILSDIIRIPLFTKTSIMYEFRNFYLEDSYINNNNELRKAYLEVESSYDNLFIKEYTENGNITYIKEKNPADSFGAEPKNTITTTTKYLSQVFSEIYSLESTGLNPTPKEELQIPVSYIDKNTSNDYRVMLKTQMYKDISGKIGTNTSSRILASDEPLHKCGYIPDYAYVSGLSKGGGN
jgi:hypothetical protein